MILLLRISKPVSYCEGMRLENGISFHQKIVETFNDLEHSLTHKSNHECEFLSYLSDKDTYIPILHNF